MMHRHFPMLSILLALVGNTAVAQSRTVKVAILENLKIEKLSTDKYATDYMDGILVASKVAKDSNIKVEVQTFFYGKEPLAIIEKVPEVKAWNPDLIIGPRSSSLFLMLRDHFKDTLVLSPFATANEVADLPVNFYSLTLPNKFFTQAVLNMVVAQFPKKALAPIIEVDCKNCMDFAAAIESSAKASGVVVRNRVTYLNKSAESAPIQDLAANIQTTDIVLLPNTSYTSGAVVARLADYLKRPELVVIGGDGWGDWSSSYVGKVKSQFAYAGYRVTPWSFESTDDRTQRFVREFKALKGTTPTGTAALLSYSTLSSALDALKSYQSPNDKRSIRDQILSAFTTARSKDPNFRRPVKYAIYKVTQDGEKFVGEAPALTEEQKK